MHIMIEDLQGNSASVNPEALIRLRPSYGQHEPSNANFVDFATGGIFSREQLNELVEKFSHHLPLAMLHSPVGTPVFLNVNAIAAIVNPDPTRHHENAHAVAIVKPAYINPLNPGRKEQQLSEDVTKASAVLRNTKVRV